MAEGSVAMDHGSRFPSADCLTAIEGYLPRLTGASRRVAEMIVRDPWAVLGMTISDVAAASGVSLPSVTRFCRAVGYPGFRELVQGIAQSLGRLEMRDLQALEMGQGPEGGLPGLAARVVGHQVTTLQNVLNTLDYQILEQAAEAIAAANHVTVIGHGAAFISAQSFAVRLNFAGISATASTPDLFSIQLVAIRPGDVVLAISNQGRTRDIIEAIRRSREFGATTVAVSSITHTPLSEVAEISLAAFSAETARAGMFLTSYNAVLAVADILAVSIAERKWDGEPPHRADVVDWIEAYWRVGPTASGASRRLRRMALTPPRQRGSTSTPDGYPR